MVLIYNIKTSYMNTQDISQTVNKMEVVKKSHQFGDDLLNGKGTFIVPTDYDHETQLDTYKHEFKAKVRKSVLALNWGYSDNITSEKFAKATNRLVPGKTYAVKMFPIVSKVQSEDCLAFLKKNNAIFVGAQGITALQSEKPYFFPKGLHTLSFDEKHALGEDPGVPYIIQCADGSLRVGLKSFDFPFDIVLNVIVCFCNLDESLVT